MRLLTFIAFSYLIWSFNSLFRNSLILLINSLSWRFSSFFKFIYSIKLCNQINFKSNTCQSKLLSFFFDFNFFFLLFLLFLFIILFKGLHYYTIISVFKSFSTSSSIVFSTCQNKLLSCWLLLVVLFLLLLFSVITSLRSNYLLLSLYVRRWYEEFLNKVY